MCSTCSRGLEKGESNFTKNYNYYVYYHTNISSKRDSNIEKQPLYKNFTISSKSVHFIMIGWDPWIKKRVNYLYCIEGKGGMRDIWRISTRQLVFFIKSLLPDVRGGKIWDYSIEKQNRNKNNIHLDCKMLIISKYHA